VRRFESCRGRCNSYELGSYLSIGGVVGSPALVLGLMAVLDQMLSNRVIKAAMASASGSTGLAMPLKSWTRACPMTAPIM
jgi:hypothetical protein